MGAVCSSNCSTRVPVANGHNSSAQMYLAWQTKKCVVWWVLEMGLFSVTPCLRTVLIGRCGWIPLCPSLSRGWRLIIAEPFLKVSALKLLNRVLYCHIPACNVMLPFLNLWVFGGFYCIICILFSCWDALSWWFFRKAGCKSLKQMNKNAAMPFTLRYFLVLAVSGLCLINETVRKALSLGGAHDSCSPI